MKRKGCQRKGTALVEHLDGSLQAKERLEVILETLAGRLTIDQACRRLGVKESQFHRMRTTMLEAGLARLEPRSAGRPPQLATAEEIHREKLERHVAELESELKIAAVREEIARVLPNRVPADASLKKTTEIPNRRR
jgi:transposase-like protein